jgi:hypothetical protein
MSVMEASKCCDKQHACTSTIPRAQTACNERAAARYTTAARRQHNSSQCFLVARGLVSREESTVHCLRLVANSSVHSRSVRVTKHLPITVSVLQIAGLVEHSRVHRLAPHLRRHQCGPDARLVSNWSGCKVRVQLVRMQG